EVDGAERTVPGGRRFCVPWPRSAVRSGTIRPDRAVTVAGTTVTFERLQSGPEGLTVRFSVRPPGDLTLRVFADGSRLDVVEQSIEEGSGRGIARGYPILRSHGILRLEVAAGREKASPVEIDLRS